MIRTFIAAAVLILVTAACARAPAETPSYFSPGETTTDYAPMEPFEKLAGRVMRGEGQGPDGAPIVDIAAWKFILGGRAFESVHRLEGGTYGGKTIMFFDEGAKEYVFHYFTTAGFHTTGTLVMVDGGFSAIEKVIGHPTYAEVRSTVTFEGENAVVASTHVTKDGKEGAGEGMIYKPFDGPPPSFED